MSSVTIMIIVVRRVFSTTVKISGCILKFLIRSIRMWSIMMNMNNTCVMFRMNMMNMNYMIWMIVVMGVMMGIRWVIVMFIVIVMVWDIITVVMVTLIAMLTVVTVMTVEVIGWLLELMLVIIVVFTGILSDFEWSWARALRASLGSFELHRTSGAFVNT